MIAIKAVLPLNGREIVPVRAVPYVTGGDISPKCLADILSDPLQCFTAFVLGPNNVVTQMLPKNWQRYKKQLAMIVNNAHDLNLIDRTTLEVLPASTFVYWDGLWRTYETNFLPPREQMFASFPAEQADYELQSTAIIPKVLVDLVFDGFQVSNPPHVSSVVNSTPKPLPHAPAPAAHSSLAPAPIGTNTSAVTSASVSRGFVYKKHVLLAKLRPIWSSIDRDFHHAKANGLTAEAKATKHGDWYEESALNWARKNGKLTESVPLGPANSVFGLPRKIHTIKH